MVAPSWSARVRQSCNSSRGKNCGVSACHKSVRSTVWAMSVRPGSARFIVSRTGAARIPPVRLVSLIASKRAKSSWCRHGRAASCTSTQLASPAACKPARTESARSLPPSTTVICGCAASGSWAKRLSPGLIAITTRVTRG